MAVSDSEASKNKRTSRTPKPTTKKIPATLVPRSRGASNMFFGPNMGGGGVSPDKPRRVK